MNELINTSNRLINSVKTDFIRSVYYEIDWSWRLIWIVWQRWVGKTTLILQYLKNLEVKNKLYFSADDIAILNDWLLKTVSNFYLNENIKVFAIDEIHKYKNWNQELKNIYDSFPDINVIFSWSSSIDLIKWKYDLSRRVNLIKMQGFSFREYINKVKWLNIEKLTLEQIINWNWVNKIYETIWDEIIYLFKNYLKIGYYPFTFESEFSDVYYNKIWWVIDKLIYEDIANFYSLDTANLEKFKLIIMFYAFSLPWNLSINSLKNKLSIAYDTAVNYLQILNEIGVIKSIYIDWVISKMIRKANKLYLDNSNLIYYFNNSIWKQVEIWTIREIFFVNQVAYKSNLFYSESWDFMSYISWEKYYFEVWGKSKKQSQIKNLQNAFIVKDDLILPIWNQIPLWVFWFLY